MLTLYQAEWCPYSSAVRQVLTELGLPFAACPVEPEPEARDELRRLSGTDSIPVLRDEDGRVYSGTDEIFGYLREREPGRYEAAHRRQYAEHGGEREAKLTERLLEDFRATA